MKKWKIMSLPESQRKECREKLFEHEIDSMSVDQLKKIAMRKHAIIDDMQNEIYQLYNIADSAKWYLSEPKLAKRELIFMLVKSGFWHPRIKRFETVTAMFIDKTDEYFYCISAGNRIAETRLFYPIYKINDELSFSCWIDKRIPIKFWNIYQVESSDKEMKNGKCVMKLPYQEPDKDGNFVLNIKGAKDFNDDTMFIIAESKNGPMFKISECNCDSLEEFKKEMNK